MAYSHHTAEASRDVLEQYVDDFADRLCDAMPGDFEWRRNWRSYFLGVYLLELYDVDTGELMDLSQEASVDVLNDSFNTHLERAAVRADRPFEPREFTISDWRDYVKIIDSLCPVALQNKEWRLITALHDGTTDYVDIAREQAIAEASESASK